MFSANLRSSARLAGALSFRLRARSSSKTTSRTQCSWFSIPQWERVIATNSAGESTSESRKYRTIGGSSLPLSRRRSSTRPTAAIPGNACLSASSAAGTTTALRCSSRPWLARIERSGNACSAIGSSRLCASANNADWFSLRASTYWPSRARMPLAMAAWQCRASAVTVQPSSDSNSRTSSAAATSLRLGATRCAIASRASAAQTLTRCSGVVRRPCSKAPRNALPSIATTPRKFFANSPMNCRKAASNATGSSKRNTRLNVSWLGIPCSRRRNCRNNGSLEEPKSAMSAQLSAPQSTAASATTRISGSSWRAFAARGSGSDPNASWKRSIRPPSYLGSRLQNPYVSPTQDRAQMRFPCPFGGGWPSASEAGWGFADHLTPPVDAMRRIASPPSPSGRD